MPAGADRLPQMHLHAALRAGAMPGPRRRRLGHPCRGAFARLQAGDAAGIGLRLSTLRMHAGTRVRRLAAHRAAAAGRCDKQRCWFLHRHRSFQHRCDNSGRLRAPSAPALNRRNKKPARLERASASKRAGGENVRGSQHPLNHNGCPVAISWRVLPRAGPKSRLAPSQTADWAAESQARPAPNRRGHQISQIRLPFYFRHVYSWGPRTGGCPSAETVRRCAPPTLAPSWSLRSESSTLTAVQDCRAGDAPRRSASYRLSLRPARHLPDQSCEGCERPA